MKRILTAVIVLPFLIASILISWLWWLFVLLAAAASSTNNHHNQEMRIDAIRKGRTMTAVRILFIRCKFSRPLAVFVYPWVFNFLLSVVPVNHQF